jgi:hypothetical protein
MISKYVQINRRNVLSLVVAAFILALAAAPALAQSPQDYSLRSLHNGLGTTGVAYEPSGVLGREGGLLSLLRVDGQANPVAALVKSKAYSLRVVHNGQSGTYVVFTRIGYLGREGGLLSVLER